MRIRRSTESLRLLTAMIGIAGTAIAITLFATPVRGAIPTVITRERKISILPVSGVTSTITAMSGIPTSQVIGLRIAMATGSINPITAGLGSATSRGAGRLTTTDAGFMPAGGGDGGRDLHTSGTVRSGRRLTFPSGDGAAALVSVLDLADGAASAGSHSDRVTGSIPGGADMVAASDGWDAVGDITASAGLVLCTAARDSRMWRTSTTRTLAGRCRR